MRFQLEDYDCGPACIVNVGAAFGKKISLQKASQLARTTNDGTDERGMLRALEKLGFEGEEFETSVQADALRWLTGQLLLGKPVILIVEKNGHWALAVGLLGNDRIVYVDSADYQKNRKENGTYVFSQRKIANLWKAKSDKTKGMPSYYGIAVRRKPA